MDRINDTNNDRIHASNAEITEKRKKNLNEIENAPLWLDGRREQSHSQGRVRLFRFLENAC